MVHGVWTSSLKFNLYIKILNNFFLGEERPGSVSRFFTVEKFSVRAKFDWVAAVATTAVAVATAAVGHQRAVGTRRWSAEWGGTFRRRRTGLSCGACVCVCVCVGALRVRASVDAFIC